MCDLFADGECVGVIWSEYSLHVEEEFGKQGESLSDVTGFTGPEGDVVSGSECVGVVWSEEGGKLA